MTEVIGAPIRPKGFDVGARLRSIRLQLGLSQRELARRAEMTNANLSMIEQGRVSPSLNTLEKILQVIPVSLAEFFRAEQDLAPAVFPQSTQSCVQRAGCRCFVATPRLPHLPPLMRHVFPPGSCARADLFLVAPGWIGGLVQQGELTLLLEETIFTLGPDDAFQFHSGRDHRVENRSNADCTFTLVGETVALQSQRKV